jgi:hypothetical protein
MPTFADVVGHVEPFAVAPAAGPIAFVPFTELTTAPPAPAAIGIAAIAITVAQFEITVAPIAAIAADSRNAVSVRTVIAEPPTPIWTPVAFAPVGAVQVGDPVRIATTGPIRIAVPIWPETSSAYDARSIRVVTAGRSSAAAVRHTQEIAELVIRSDVRPSKGSHARSKASAANPGIVRSELLRQDGCTRAAAIITRRSVASVESIESIPTGGNGVAARRSRLPIAAGSSARIAKRIGPRGSIYGAVCGTTV